MTERTRNHVFSLLFLTLLNVSAIILIHETYHFHAIVAFLIVYSSVNVCFVLLRLNRIETFHQHLSPKIDWKTFINESLEIFDIKVFALFWGIFYLTSFLYGGRSWLVLALFNFLIAYTIACFKRRNIMKMFINK